MIDFASFQTSQPGSGTSIPNDFTANTSGSGAQIGSSDLTQIEQFAGMETTGESLVSQHTKNEKSLGVSDGESTTARETDSAASAQQKPDKAGSKQNADSAKQAPDASVIDKHAEKLVANRTRDGHVDINGLAHDIKTYPGKADHHPLAFSVMSRLSQNDQAQLKAALQPETGSSGVRLNADGPRDYYSNFVAQSDAKAGNYNLAELAEAGHGCAYCHISTGHGSKAEANAAIDLKHYNRLAVGLGVSRDILMGVLGGKPMLSGPRTLPRSGPIVRGSVGAMSRAEAIARRFHLNINSPTTRQVLNSLDDTVANFVAKFRRGGITRELPSEVMEMTLEKALEHSSKVRKLLLDGRFAK